MANLRRKVSTRRNHCSPKITSPFSTLSTQLRNRFIYSGEYRFIFDLEPNNKGNQKGDVSRRQNAGGAELYAQTMPLGAHPATFVASMSAGNTCVQISPTSAEALTIGGLPPLSGLGTRTR